MDRRRRNPRHALPDSVHHWWNAPRMAATTRANAEHDHRRHRICQARVLHPKQWTLLDLQLRRVGRLPADFAPSEHPHLVPSLRCSASCSTS